MLRNLAMYNLLPPFEIEAVVVLAAPDLNKR